MASDKQAAETTLGCARPFSEVRDYPACVERGDCLPSAADAVESPWAANRNGDPRQLLHEAEQLERTARVRRDDAARLRAQAIATDEGAVQMERAAADYRQWAKENANAAA
jgi:hypothetical protein